MVSTEMRTVTAGAQTIPYELTRKRVKNLNLRVRADGSVAVSAAPRVPIGEIERFVRAHADFIRRAQARVQERAAQAQPPLVLADGVILPLLGRPYTVHIQEGKNGVQLMDDMLLLCVRDVTDTALCLRVLRKFLRDEAARVLGALLERIAPLFAPHPPTVPTLSLRDMKTRWGICRPTQNRITLNTRLVHVPLSCAAYVIYHECAHFRYPNHSEQFYAHLARFLPDWQEQRRALNAAKIPMLY
ncbi:MAG: M48 family metallopeptidase [Clostridia bacterium]|nr:M48 family metallopeptidase [Clostridia bacterium]